VSEWLLFNAKWVIFQLHVYHDEDKFDEMIIMSDLYQNNTFSWNLVVLALWNNRPLVDMSLHLDQLSWFQTKQSLLFLLNALCLAEEQQIPIL